MAAAATSNCLNASAIAEARPALLSPPGVL
jgi:hypothetical protein